MHNKKLIKNISFNSYYLFFNSHKICSVNVETKRKLLNQYYNDIIMFYYRINGNDNVDQAIKPFALKNRVLEYYLLYSKILHSPSRCEKKITFQ
jgi:hypothetical protein